MRVGIFARLEDKYLDLYEGCKALGYRVKAQRPSVWSEDQAEGFDLVFTNGLWGKAQCIYDTYAARDSKVIVVDLAIFDRDNQVALWAKRLNRLPRKDLPGDRASKVFPERIDRYRTPGQLIVGQMPDDRSHGLSAAGLYDWYCDVAATLTGPVYFRPHPRFPAHLNGFRLSKNCKAEFETEIEQGYDLYCTYCSQAGWKALWHDKKVLCSRNSPYYEASLASLNNEWAPVARHFFRLSYTQWTREELRSGEAVEKVLEVGFS